MGQCRVASFLLGILFIVISVGVSAKGFEPRRAEESDSDFTARRAEESGTYTVQILNKVINAFAPDPQSIQGGSGTGTIREITEDKGYIVTNRHVILAKREKNEPVDLTRGEIVVQHIEIVLSVPGEKDEKIRGYVDYISDELDMAVVVFNPKDIKRAKITAATLPANKEEYEKLVKVGRQVFARGNPFGVRDYFTTGIISEVPREGYDSEARIGTDAAVNEGNSGGPLVDLDSGKVVGTITYKLAAAMASNMSWAIPASVWDEEYQRYRNADPSFGKGYLYLDVRPATTKILEAEGLRPLVESLIPEFFNLYPSFVVVQNAVEGSVLQAGDKILMVEGVPIGNQVDAVKMLAATAGKDSLRFTVIRGREIQELVVPLVNLRRSEERRKTKFVVLGGLLLQDLTPKERAEYLSHGKGGVIVSEILPFTPAVNLLEKKLITVKSVIYEVQINGVSFPIRHLGDLRRAIRQMVPGQAISIFSYQPQLTQVPIDERRRALIPVVNENGQLVLGHGGTYAYLNANPIFDDTNFSIEKFSNQFDFDFQDPARVDWRQSVDLGCGRLIQKLQKNLEAYKRTIGRSGKS